MLGCDEDDVTYVRRTSRKRQAFRVASRCQVSMKDRFNIWTHFLLAKNEICFCFLRWSKSVTALRPSKWSSQLSVSQPQKPHPPASLQPTRNQQTGLQMYRCGVAFLGHTQTSSHLCSLAPLWSTCYALPQAPPTPLHQAPPQNAAGRSGDLWTCTD